MKNRGVIFSLIILGLFFAFTSHAADLTIALDREFSGGTAPAGTAPWATAYFTNGNLLGTDGVFLKMEATNLTGTEKITIWDFNYSGDVSSLATPTFVSAQSTGPVASGVGISSNSFKADGDGYFDIQFSFPTSNDIFGSGEYVTYFFAAATANQFNAQSVDGNDPSKNGLFSAAHVQSIYTATVTDGSGWITGSPEGVPTPTPEPGSLLLLGLGLIGAGAVARKRIKK